MSAQATTRGESASKGKQRAYWFYGGLAIVHVSGEETEGRFSLVEEVQPPGAWTPLHVHRRADQTLYVLEGELTLHLPGKSVAIGPGECAYGPLNVPHTDHITSAEPARVLVVNSPAGFQEFVIAAGQPAAELTLPPPDEAPPDLERLAALAAEHHIELLGPPGSLP
jgi:mannose-6-phosphate isomerase-like protein (cupin superfamily)